MDLFTFCHHCGEWVVHDTNDLEFDLTLTVTFRAQMPSFMKVGLTLSDNKHNKSTIHSTNQPTNSRDHNTSWQRYPNVTV